MPQGRTGKHNVEQAREGQEVRKSTLPLHLMHAAPARWRANEDGATAIEYALIASGIGAAVAATVWSLGTALTDAISIDASRAML